MDDQTREPGSTVNEAVSERMRALLSRAAEDQIVEQRAVSISLTDLRDEVMGVADAVRSGVSAGAVEQLRSELTGNASEVRHGFAQVGERLDALTDRVAALDVLTRDQAREVAEQVLSGVASLVRESELASERRILAHVDEAVLALAEALLRRRRTARPDALLAGETGPAAEAPGPTDAEPEGLARALHDSALDAGALDTGALDIEELDRSLAAAADEAGREPDDSPVFDNDADAEVSTDAPAGSVDEVGSEAVSTSDNDGDEPAQDVVGSDKQDAEEGPARDVLVSPERPAFGGQQGVTGGSAPRRARTAVPPLPPVVPASETPHDDHDEDSRRRPWWRPGG